MTDRTPTGDLRERLAEALTREHYRRARERIEASPEEHCAGFADAVLPIIEGLPNRGYCEHCGRGDCAPTAEQYHQLTQRAEEAERERDDYRQRFANQMTAATELTTTLREAERKLQQALEAIADERRDKLAAQAAVRRVRALAEHPEIFVGDTFIAVADGQQVQLIRASDVLAALDADQPKQTPTCCWFDGDRCMTHGTDQLKEDGT